LIATERLIVRLAEPADVPEIVNYYRENRAHLQPFKPVFEPELLDPAAWVDQVASRQREFSLGESFRAFLFLRASPRRIIGNINLSLVVRGAAQSCVLAYNLAKDAQGHGYMTEAVRAMVDFAFHDLGLHRVAASYMPRNERSARVLERAGFEIEGRAPDYLCINGRWEDHILTAITNSEPPPPL
jgi:[ribosomal protein S5]-alanine N-acetyltransferase